MVRRGRVQRRKPGQSTPGESSGSKAASRTATAADDRRKPGGSSGTEAIPNEWHKRSAELNPKYKSQLCKSFMEKGPDGCRFGDGCVFAHGAHELRVAQKGDVVATTRRARGSKGNKAQGERKPRLQVREDAAEEQCRECGSRPVTPVYDEEPELPEWAIADIEPATEFSFDCTINTGPPLLARSDSVLAADSLFLDETIDTSTVADGPVVYGEEASPESQLRSRFSFATATPREHPKQWVSSQVVSWVRSRNVPDEVAALFAEHEVDGDDLLSMTKTELREVGVTKIGHQMKLVKGIAELNGTTSTAPMKTMVVADALRSEHTGSNLKDLTRLVPLTSTVSAQAVGPSQLIAEAAAVIKQSDNVPGLNDVLQSAVMANKAAEVIRGEAEGVAMPLSLCMHAAKHGRVGCLERLLRELAAQETVNAVRVDDGCSALHLAAYSGSAGCVKLLLKAGADASLVNRYGENAADCAAKQGHGMLSKLIGQAAGNVASLALQSDSMRMVGRSLARQPSERFTKIMQPRRHAKKSRDTLGSELSAWRNGNVASAA